MKRNLFNAFIGFMSLMACSRPVPLTKVLAVKGNYLGMQLDDLLAVGIAAYDLEDLFTDLDAKNYLIYGQRISAEYREVGGRRVKEKLVVYDISKIVNKATGKVYSDKERADLFPFQRVEKIPIGSSVTFGQVFLEGDKFYTLSKAKGKEVKPELKPGDDLNYLILKSCALSGDSVQITGIYYEKGDSLEVYSIIPL
jgi:hypothetical protein